MRLVADNLQITLPAIQQAVHDMDPDPIQDLVRRCLAAGAQAIDINSGPLSRKPEEKMSFLVNTVQEATDLPLLLDTTNPTALEAGLQVGRNPMIINGFSLEPAKITAILPLAAAYDADIIGYLLDPNGHVPADASGRMEVAVKLYDEFQKAGIDDNRLIIDPVVAPLMWADGVRQNMDVLAVLRALPDLLGFSVRSIAGVSNLTTGGGPLANRLLLERSYVPMLAAAGLTMALVNVFHSETVEVVNACNKLTNGSVFTWETL